MTTFEPGRSSARNAARFFSTARRPTLTKIGRGRSIAAARSGLKRSVSTPRVHIAKSGWLASRIPARADGVPQRQARRPGRFDPPAARLAQAGRPRAPRHLPVLQGARPSAAARPARAIIGDGEAAGPPLVTRRQRDHIAEECRGLEVRRALSAFRPLRTGSRRIHHYSFTRCAFIASARKPGQTVEHRVKQGAKACALAKAVEDRAGLLLENAITDFVGSTLRSGRTLSSIASM